MTALLTLEAVTGVRGGRRLFADVSLDVPAGALLRVQGRNGAGKTSLLRMLCGLMPPAAGRILWRGEPVTASRDDFHRELVYLGHAPALKDDLTPLENLAASCRLGGQAADEPQALRALAAAGLQGRERRPSRMLSQGQRKRVALARLVLSVDAALWVLDEPFNALDVDATEWLLGLVQAHLARGGITVLTSHQPVALPDSVAQRSLAL